jgi:hypothetical protein
MIKRSKNIMSRNFNTIKSDFFIDPELSEKLDTLEKRYIYLFLLLNSRVEYYGIYKISSIQIANETGIDKKSVEKILTEFEKLDIIIRNGFWIYLKSFFPNQMQKYAKRTEKELMDNKDIIPKKIYEMVLDDVMKYKNKDTVDKEYEDSKDTLDEHSEDSSHTESTIEENRIKYNRRRKEKKSLDSNSDNNSSSSLLNLKKELKEYESVVLEEDDVESFKNVFIEYIPEQKKFCSLKDRKGRVYLTFELFLKKLKYESNIDEFNEEMFEFISDKAKKHSEDFKPGNLLDNEFYHNGLFSDFRLKFDEVNYDNEDHSLEESEDE